ncbi:MAG: hypothetical protein M1825_001235 [Sarcosagium campestre]|nr:MAG: hypothetical protein M1825_001235 [Sarcosagium campestre]
MDADPGVQNTWAAWNSDSDSDREIAATQDDFGNGCTSFPSYRAYVAFMRIRNRNFQWLDDFFKLSPQDDRSKTSTFVLDSVGGQLIPRGNANRRTLEYRPACVSVRVVVFSYYVVWNIDRNALDDVCYSLRLDPIFIWQFLDDDFSYYQAANIPDRVSKLDRNAPFVRQFRSERPSLDVKFNYYGDERLSAMILDPAEQGGLRTVFLVAQISPDTYLPHFSLSGKFGIHQRSSGRFRPGTTYKLYRSILKSWTKEDVDAAERAPIRFILPYMRLLLFRYAGKIVKSELRIKDITHPKSSQIYDAHLSAGEAALFHVSYTADDITASLESLEHFASLHGNETMPETLEMALDLRALSKDAIRLKETIRDSVSRRAAVLSLEESRKSIQMANSVKRLTQLAAVFVPLTFSISIFGANVREFGSGSVPVWAFVVTVLLVSAATAAVWWLSIVITTGTVYNARARAYVLVHLAWRSPSCALILLLYFLCHSGMNVNEQLYQLGLSGEPDDPWPSFRVCRRSFPRVPLKFPWIKSFWPNLLYRISLYTSQDGWRSDVFYKRRKRSKFGVVKSPVELGRRHSGNRFGV